MSSISNDRVHKLREKTIDNMFLGHISGISSTCFTIASLNPDDSLKLTACFAGAAITTAVSTCHFLKKEKDTQYLLNVAEKNHVIHAF